MARSTSGGIFKSVKRESHHRFSNMRKKPYAETKSTRYYDRSVLAAKDDKTLGNKISHGTGAGKLLSALNKYLCETSPADYDLPEMFGNKQSYSSLRRNTPAYSISNQTKMPWFPNRDVEFAGKIGPAATKYNSPN